MINSDVENFQKYSYPPFSFLLTANCPSRDKIIAAVLSKELPGKVIRCQRRRNIFVYENTFIKKYVFKKLSDILHSNRYGSYEFSCYRNYLDNFGTCPGVYIPELYGCFNAPKWLFFSSSNGIITEYIPDVRYFNLDELQLTCRFFAHLAEKGIYHPDMQIKNLLYNEQKKMIYPIDLMGCNFLHEANLEILIIMLARFVRTAGGDGDKAQELLQNSMKFSAQFEDKVDRACNCIKEIFRQKIRITTYQRKKMVFLPEDIRKILYD